VDGHDGQTDLAVAPASIDGSEVLREHRDWIERLIVARTGSRELVEDILQEVGLAVSRSAARPARAAEVEPWLCAIVVRQCALALRERARTLRKLEGFRESLDAADAGEPDPMVWLLHEEQRTIVRDELARLDPAARRLLVWKYVQNASYPEIAARLGVTRHVAEYRVLEARKLLRRRLERRGLGGSEAS
jgi:RNA polymerase sigma factor (sigma-70 family)